MPRVLVLVLCFDEHSRAFIEQNYAAHVGDWLFLLHINTTKYLENEVYLRWAQANEDKIRGSDYVGTLSWRFVHKIGIPPVRVLARLLEAAGDAQRTGFDVWAMHRIHQSLVVQGQRSHPHFAALWTAILGRLGFSTAEALDPRVPFFACNYWIARPSLFLDYCAFLRRAVEIMERDADLQPLLDADARYGCPPPEAYRRVTGRSTYSHHPFVLERLPCFFFYQQGVRVVYSLPQCVWDAAFDWEAYWDANPDLRGRLPRTRDAMQTHFERHGAAENRPLRASNSSSLS